MTALNSCLIDSQLILPPYGIVQVEIAEDSGAVTRADDQTMKTVRMIAFSTPHTTPKVEFNEMFTDFVVIPPTTPEGLPKVRFNLKIERKDNPTENDKLLVVAIINEPQDSGEPNSIQDILNKENLTFDDLKGLQVKMSEFVTDNHQALATDRAIPMTGVLMTNYVRLLEERDLPTSQALELVAHRAVARVDVFLKRDTGSGGVVLDPNLTMTSGSTIQLEKTWGVTNLIHHVWDTNNTLGEMQSVDSEDLFSKTWTATASSAVSAYESVPVCSFYTPERHCETDPLKLNVSIKTSEGTTRSGTLVITQAYEPTDTERENPIAVNDILRNHKYKVIVTITSHGISGEILDWKPETINTAF